MDKKIAAKVAAKWWTEQIRYQAVNFKGDVTSVALRAYALSQQSPVTEQQLSVFEKALERIIVNDIDDKDWREDNPIWGSYIRTIGSDYGPDKQLDSAFKAANIPTLFCPTKTIMWINPDRVFTDSGFEWIPAANGLNDTPHRG